MKYLSAALPVLLALSTPICLVVWVWTGDHRWFATALLIVAFFVAAAWLSKERE